MPQINKILNGLSGRYIFLMVLSFVVIIVLSLRLGQLQLSQGSDYIEAIRKQSLRPIRIPAVRGRIESADGQILVDNQVSYDLMFFLKEFKLRGAGGLTRTSEYMASVLQQLASMLDLKSDISQKDILNKLLADSRERVVLITDMTSKQMKGFQKMNLPPFIEMAEKDLFLNYSKVEILNKMNGRERTAESICREIDRVSSLIGRPMEDHRKKVLKHLEQKPALPYKALEDLSQYELSIISEMVPSLDGTSIEPNARRAYPYPVEYSHLLGYTRLKDPAKEDEEERASFHYYLRSLYGVNGLESKMEKDLQGVAGRKVVQVNIGGFVQSDGTGKHSVIEEADLDKFNYPAQNGRNVILTLDHEAQKLAYDLLVSIPRHTLGVPLQEGQQVRSAFVLMDCETGEIKAMVSTPSYDLSRFREYKYYKEINNPETAIPYALKQQPLINRALSTYEPGSIIKPLLSLSGLEYGNLDPDHELECEGFFELPTGKKIRDASKWGHGPISLGGAIEQSCNKYFITLGLEMGIEPMQKVYKHAGIGRYPMALKDKRRFTQERSGLMPGESKTWYLADTAYCSIGQGKIKVSPLQAAVFVGAIANGGKVLRPQLIKEVRDSKNEKVIRRSKLPDVIDKLPVSLENIEIVQQGMRRVVVGENASATTAQAKIEGALEMAGKTGTAEVVYAELNEEGKLNRDLAGKPIFKKIKNTWFTAYAPYDKPKYVAICFVQGGIFGGTTCAPMVRKFFDTWSKTKPVEAGQKKQE
ncbi:MAG: penicillin-binding transpeptidase domain-containing protein [Lentisphaeraceae bacterium]|nr:penicillin-binding transpeptidase domain-containing protein [Lentisphaeraceae bacterium]